MEETELIRKRFAELAQRSYSKGQFTFTSFCGMSELSIFYEERKNLEYARPKVYGGYDDSERSVVRFGSPEELGYEEDFPIDMIEISPVAEKFADDLTHRDFLGALMSMGIERELLGDIIVTGKKAFVFCLNRISDYIIDNMTSVKHTMVNLRKAEITELGNVYHGFEKEKQVQVASDRCDAVISKVYNISRNAALEYFRQKKVFVNGRYTENTSLVLKEGDMVTVRGFGRFKLLKIGGLSRKGRLNLTVGE
ncbi:MAG: hypothetical protein IKP88_09395 [Lachnospiraceae bacterium]|nr:hypothetical protein [Lachnospiraceae bacterium]